MALLVDILIAARLGAAGATDALIIALTLPRLLGTVGREATKFSLLTVFIHTRQDQGEEAFRDFARRVLNLFLLIGAVVTVAGIVLAGPAVRVMGPGLGDEAQLLAVWLLQLCSPVALFALGSAVLEVTLNSQKQFVITALRNAVSSLAIVAVVLVTWRSERAAMWIAAGHSAGYCLLFFTLLHYTFHRLGIGWNPLRWPTRCTLRQLRGTIALPLAGFGVRQGSRVIERAIASLAPGGGVAAYYFAYRLLGSLQNLVGVSVALTGQPRLTEHDLAGDPKRFTRMLRQRAIATVLISLPIAAAVMLLSKPAIALLYGYGKFDPAAIDLTSDILWYLGPAVVFYCVTPVLMSGLYARKRFGLVLYNMCLAGAANVILAWRLFSYMGLTGLAAAVSASSAISVVNLLILLTIASKQAGSVVTASAATSNPQQSPAATR